MDNMAHVSWVWGFTMLCEIQQQVTNAENNSTIGC